jgi:hypothetical protein
MPPLLAVGVPLVIGVIHVLVVAHHYHVGSFDDDASYILSAKAILSGHGLTGRLPSGAVVVGSYPPGYPLLLAPLVWITHGYGALRALSLGCYALLFPLTWCYLGRRRLPDALRIAVLALMALNPVLATFGSMVMAETPFLVVFLVALLLLDRWDGSSRVLSPVGVGVIVSMAGMVWLKEAAIAMIAGVVAWLLLRREVRKAAAAAAGSLLLLAPVAIGRLITGVPLTGSRYSQELGGYYTGTILDRATHVWSAIGHYLSTALPASVVPIGAPLPLGGWAHDLLVVLAWHVPVLCVVGLVVWIRRYWDAAVVVVLFYVAETLLWPAINERRVILVLPVVLAWYVVGAWSLLAWLGQWFRRRESIWTTSIRPGMATMCALAVIVALVAQFPRDYLFGIHQNSSRPIGSPYAAMLASLGAPRDVVETDYLSTIALVSGHRTADAAFIATLLSCPDDTIGTALAGDNAGYLLVGALNKPEQVGSPCMLSEATSQPWAVRLLRTEHDLATVFELIGPGTGHPDLTDATAAATVSGSAPVDLVPIAPLAEGDNAGTMPVTAAESGTGVLTWDWGHAATLRQVSVGAAGATAGPTGGVTVQVRQPSGEWVPVAATAASVGDAPGGVPFLLTSFPQGMVATAVRVVVRAGGLVSAMDVHALADTGTT